MKLLFIQTGGTIDKDYPHTTKGWAFEIAEPAATRVLALLNPSFEYEIISASQKDSQKLTKADPQAVDQLYRGKKIIITGAMRPERFSNSDAAVNLGTAIGAAASLPAGVFIAMHGVVKPFTDIKRDLTTGKYY